MSDDTNSAYKKIFNTFAPHILNSILNDSGGASNPTYSFIYDALSGLYNPSVGELAFSTDGTLRMDISTTAISSYLQYLNLQGTETLPSYSFLEDSNTGMYSVSDGVIGFSCNGVLQVSISSTGIIINIPFWLGPGSAAQPAYSFGTDTHTGMFLAATSDLAFSSGGVQRMDISTSAITSTLPVYHPSGTAASPSVTFTSDSNTGMYSISDGVLGFATDGVLRVSISSTGVVFNVPFLLGPGSAASPAYSFDTDTHTGMFLAATNDLAFSTNGVQRMDISTTAMTSTLPVYHSNGTAGSPTITFTSDNTTGLYRVGAGDVGISTSGVLRFDVSTSAVSSTLPVYHPSGSAANPSITFTSDTDTGIYSISNGVLGFSTDGVLRVSISSAGVVFNVPFLVGPGSAADPSYSFDTDAHTGMFLAATSDLAFSSGGVQRLDISTTDITSTLPIVHPNGAVGSPSVTFASDTTSGMYLIGAGDVGISTSGVLRFDVSTSAVSSTLPVYHPNGTAGSPTITFTSDNTTGIYRVGAGDVGISTSGVLRLDVSTSAVSSTLPVYHPNGSAGNPSTTFTSDNTTGIYLIGAGDVGVSTSGTLRLDVSTSAITSTLPIYNTSGSATNPSFTFSSDSNTGMYSVSDGVLGITTDGVLRVSISSTGIIINVPFWLGSGTAANPTYSFSADTSTGMFLAAVDDLAFSSGGVQRLDISTSAITSTLPIYNANGSAATPSLVFTSDTTTGIYRVGAGDIGIATSGVLRFDISTTAATSTLPIYIPNGSFGSPSFAFASDNTTGVYRVGAGDIGITTSGTLRFDVSTVAVSSTLPIRVANGTAATPSFAFSSNTGTGLYRVGVGDIGIATSGTLRFDISTTAVTSTLPIYNANGSAATPSLVFTSDTTTGIYRVGAGDIGIATSGVLRFDISTSAITSTLPIYNANGSAATPSMTFTSDNTTGIYLIGAGDIGISTSGTLRLDVSTSAITSTLPIYHTSGLVATPSITFTSDAATGLYLIGAGDVGISTSGTLRLDVSTSAITSTLPVYHPSGAAATPSITFTSDSDTGMYSVSDGVLGFTTNGVLRVSISSTGIIINVPFWLGSGSAANPTYSFSADTTTGMFLAAVGDLAFSSGGVQRLDVSTTAITSTLPIYHPSNSAATPSITFTSDSTTGAYLIGAGDIGISTSGTLRFDVSTTAVTSTLPIYNANGSAATPSLVFTSDTTTGLYRVGAGDIGIATSGTLRFDISTTAVTSTLPIYNANGSAVTPSLVFTSDTTTGIYRVGSGDIGIATSGTLRFDVSTTAVTSTLPIYNANGSAATPSLVFTSDTTTGIYRVGAGDIGVATSGVLRFDISTTAATCTLPLSVTDSTASTSSSTGSIKTAGGYSSSNTTDASSSTNGGSGTLAGGLAVAKTCYAGNVKIAYRDGTATNPQFSMARSDGGLQTKQYMDSSNNYIITNGSGGGNISFQMADSGVSQFEIKPNVVTRADIKFKIMKGDGVSSYTTICDIEDTGATFSIATTFTSTIKCSNGSAATPSLVFTSDTTTGIYRVGAGDIGIATSGVLRMDVSTTAITSTLPIYNANGSAATPSLVFTSDTTTGIYRVGAGDIGIATSGVLRFDISTTAVTSTLPIYNANGSAATPSLVFTSDTATGIYRVGAGDIGIATSGVLRFDISTTAITSTLPIYNANGSAATPSLVFTSDTTTGIYRVGAGDIGISTSGTLRFDISTTAVTSTLPIYNANGSAATPSLVFTSDTTTGIYRVGAGDIGVATSGVLRFDISTTAATCTLPLSVTDSTASTSSSTGSIKTAGGYSSSNTTDASSSTNGGSCTLAGGLAVAKKSYFGGDLTYGSVMRSTSQPLYIVRGSGGSQTINSAAFTTLSSPLTGTTTIQGTEITYSTGIFTMTTAGLYLITAGVKWNTNGTGIRQVAFGINGSTTDANFAAIGTISAYGSNVVYQEVTAVYEAAANDTITLLVYQDSGGTLACVVKNNQSFSAYRLC